MGAGVGLLPGTKNQGCDEQAAGSANGTDPAPGHLPSWLVLSQPGCAVGFGLRPWVITACVTVYQPSRYLLEISFLIYNVAVIEPPSRVTPRCAECEYKRHQPEALHKHLGF